MSSKPLGAIQDLTVATEFSMVAARQLTVSSTTTDPEVQQFLRMAIQKLKPLLTSDNK